MNDCYFALRAALTVMRSVDYLRIEADNGLAALAELERAAADPVAWMYDKGDEEGLTTPFNPLTTPGHGGRKNIRPLYAAPPALVAEIREVVVTDEMAERVQRHAFMNLPQTTNAAIGRKYIAAVRAELGPALGLVEIREPTPEECERIYSFWMSAEGCNGRTLGERMGRIMFDAVRAVMRQKEGL